MQALAPPLTSAATISILSAGKAIARVDAVGWGQTGVTVMDSRLGCIIGPPAEREYAVLPVGVEKMSPSAE